ncbi:MAG: DUF393 domain-containing protein [Verrucomicrobiota bacterium]
MNRLTVLYDGECALCVRCRHWLARQPAWIALEFVPLQSPEVARRFPALVAWPQLNLREKLVVISDDGAIYQGHNAWIMCLYALRDYRDWALRLAQPALRPLARRVCQTVSHHRFAFSRFAQSPLTEIIRTLRVLHPRACPRKGGC